MVRSAVAMDQSITAPMLELALAALRGECIARAGDRTEAGTGEILTDIVTIKEVCRHLHVDRTTVWRMMNAGVLARVFGSGNRCIGVSRDSVARVLRGEVKVTRKRGKRK